MAILPQQDFWIGLAGATSVDLVQDFAPLLQLHGEPPLIDQLADMVIDHWGDRFDDMYDAAKRLTDIAGDDLGPLLDNAYGSQLGIGCVARDHRTAIVYQLHVDNHTSGTPQQIARGMGLDLAGSMLVTRELLKWNYLPDRALHVMLRHDSSKVISDPTLCSWMAGAHAQIEGLLELSTFLHDRRNWAFERMAKDAKRYFDDNPSQLRNQLLAMCSPAYYRKQLKNDEVNTWVKRSMNPSVYGRQMKSIANALDKVRLIELELEKQSASELPAYATIQSAKLYLKV